MNEQNISYLLYAAQDLTPAQRGQRLLQQCAPQLLALGLEGLQILVHDQDVKTPPTAPRMWGPKPFVAQVNIWFNAEQVLQRQRYEQVLGSAGFALHGWLVDEWLYTEYGENSWQTPRDWPDGSRSPGVVAITIIQRPPRIAQDEWMRRWFAWQSPMSEWLQPRSRYVRNLLTKAITPQAPAYDGIVEEAWPSHEQVVDKKKFFNASNNWQLVCNMLTMAKSVNRFLRMTRLTNVMASEYFIKTPAGLCRRMAWGDKSKQEKSI